MKKVERFLVMLLFIGIIARLMLANGSTLILLLALMGLAFVYMYLGFAFFNDIGLRGIFKKKSYKNIVAFRLIFAILSGFTLSFACLSVFFKLQHYPGAHVMLGGAVWSTAVILLVGIANLFARHGSYYKKIVSRMAFFLMICGILFFTPSQTYTEVMERDNPEYVKAYDALLKDPGNKELRDKCREAGRNMNRH